MKQKTIPVLHCITSREGVITDQSPFAVPCNKLTILKYLGIKNGSKLKNATFQSGTASYLKQKLTFVLVFS